MNDFEYLSELETLRKKSKSLVCVLCVMFLLYCTIKNYQNWMFFWGVLLIAEVIPSDTYPIKTFFAIKQKLEEEKELNE